MLNKVRLAGKGLDVMAMPEVIRRHDSPHQQAQAERNKRLTVANHTSDPL
jgi:hypothetical protein